MYFKNHIDEQTTPSLKECQQFLEWKKLSKTPKQIQDFKLIKMANIHGATKMFVGGVMKPTLRV